MNAHYLWGARALLMVLLVVLAPASPLSAATLITRAQIIDGSGAAPFLGSVRVDGERIVAVGEVAPMPGDTIVDANGLALAPGFIDTHSHSDRLILARRDATPKITQGITSVVVGQDGDAPFPLADFFAALEATPAKVNVAAYAGHNTLRDAIMGEDFRREATRDEWQQMASLLQQELAAGALGLSTGLEYEPGIHSARAEVLYLAQRAADAGGRYISHVRSEDRWFEAAIEEIIAIGRVTGMPVQISHIKLAMTRLWGTADDLLKRLDAARDEGIALTADIYPYTYWQSNMMVLLPERDPTDLEAIDFVLDQLAPPDGIIFTHYPVAPEYVGKNLSQIAEMRDESARVTFSVLAQQSIAHEAATGEMGDMMIGTSMQEADIATLLGWPHANICTDGSLEDRHPRGAGSFPRVLGHYTRDAGVLTLAEAVHKMTGLAASHLGWRDRGTIAPGMVADLVLFDPDTIADRATTEAPFEAAVGVRSVWVSGVPVLEEGTVTAAFPGRVIRRAGS